MTAELPTPAARHRIVAGHVVDVLAKAKPGRIQAVCTSPPYWGLRDYGLPPVAWPEVRFAPMPGLPEIVVPAQDACLGLEKDPWAYVGHLVHVFREVRRVLRDDGTLWLNLGDSYAANRSYQVPSTKGGPKHAPAQGYEGSASKVPPGLKAKDLVGIPWRVAFALQTDGWFFRADNIWGKANPMPESVRDRTTRAHEYVFHFAKSARYFYDAGAVAEAAVMKPQRRITQRSEHPKGDEGRPEHRRPEGGANPTSRNLRSVWLISSKPFKGAHFATFPPDLVEIMIKAGTSERGCCSLCYAPHRRAVERYRTLDGERNDDLPAMKNASKAEPDTSQGLGHWRIASVSRTVGWEPSCGCDSNVVPCVVLDPFSGAGTTALVARRLGRSAVGIEMRQEYADMAEARIAKEFPV